MNVRKTAISIAVGTFMISGAAWADTYDADLLSDNETYVDASTANTATDSFNTDTDLLSNNTDNSVTATDSSTTTDADVDLLSNNTDSSTTDNSTSTDADVDLLSNNTDNSVDNSGNSTSTNTATWTNSANTLSNSESYELDIDSEIVVANASLQGSITNVGVEYDGGGFLSSGVSVNNMNTMDGMNTAAGIITVSQNSGSNSLTQQSVTTNASLFTE